MTRLLLPAAAVVEWRLNVWWKLPQQLRGSQRRREGFWGLPPRLLKSRLLDAISEAVALTVDLFDERSPRRKLSERRCRHKTFAERDAACNECRDLPNLI